MMTINDIQHLWSKAVNELLESNFSDDIINCLALQTVDSIRRVNIYKRYRERAEYADKKDLSYHHTSNPFTLAQRDSLSPQTRVWIVYLATYFGKSDTSKWNLFNKAAFSSKKELMHHEYIINNKEEYYKYLMSCDFFRSSKYSNHRKYTKKSLDGDKGAFTSFDFMIDNIEIFTLTMQKSYDDVYKSALHIPNFGRMAAFDFTSSLCKCGLNVEEPKSMYHKYSTGPLSAIKEMLVFAGIPNPQRKLQIEFGDDLLKWFDQNSYIYMLAQVLEDAICNWQKSPTQHIRYFG